MTRPIFRAALAALAACLLVAGCSPNAKPLARIGTHVVTTTELLDAARGNELQYPQPPEQAKKAVLQDLVRRELLLEAARRAGLDTSAFARRYLESTTDRATLEALYAKLAPQDPGVTEGEERRMYEWRKTKATAHVIYTPEIAAARAAAADLARGDAFAAVADRYNLPGSMPPGGAVGAVSPGSLVPPLDEALLTLPLKKVGGPYETTLGCFLLMVSEREPATDLPPFELAQQQIRDVVRQRKARQTMNNSIVDLRDAYHARVEPGAAATMFRLLTPSRVGDAQMPNPMPEERAEALGRWDGGTYTLGEAMEDLQRPDIQKPAANMTPALEQWIRSQVLTRVMRIEAKRRHVGEEPAVARRIRGEYERYLLEGEFQTVVAGINSASPEDVEQVWNMMKGQYQQLERATIQWIVLPDSASAAQVGMHGGHNGGTLADAARMAGFGSLVHEDVVTFPTSDPNWITMRETLTRMQPGEWAGPEHVGTGYRYFQMGAKVQGEVTLDKLPPDMRASVESNAVQMARERRLNAFTDSLQTVLRPNLYLENLASVPWPPPPAVDVGR